MSDKKKHHSFRIGLTAPEVMRRLEAHTDRIEIHTVDIHGYDLTVWLGLSQLRISFREDAESEETVVFVEDDGRNADSADLLEFLLNERKYLRKPIYRSRLYRLVAALFGVSIHDINIAASPETVLETIYQFKHPTGQLIFPDNKISGIYDVKYYIEPSNLNHDVETTLYLHQGISSDNTRLLYEVVPSTVIPCLAFLVILVFPIILSGIVVMFSRGIPFSELLVLAVIFAFAFWSVSTIRHTRKVHREFDKWFKNELQTCLEKAKNDSPMEIDSVLLSDDQTIKHLSSK